MALFCAALVGAGLLICAALAPKPASAALMTNTYAVTVAGFTRNPSIVLADPVTGSFDVEFDPDDRFTPVAITNVHLNIGPISKVIATLFGQSLAVFFSGRDFIALDMGFDHVFSQPNFVNAQFVVGEASAPATLVALSVSAPDTEVPEPAGSLLLATALAGLGLVRMRHRVAARWRRLRFPSPFRL